MGIVEKLEQLEKKIEELEPKKKKRSVRDFKIPSKGKVKGSKARQNYVCVIRLQENMNLDFKKYKVIDQTIMDDDIPRLASSGHIWMYKRIPIIILPNWSVDPLSGKDLYASSLSNGSNSAGYRLLLSRMKTELVNAKKKVTGMGLTIFGIIIAIVIGYALISGGGA